MYPLLLEWSGLTIYSYGAFAGLGVVVALFWGLKEARARGMEPWSAAEAALVGLLFGVLGARLLYILVELPHYLDYPSDVVYLWDGGLIWFGALGLGVPAAFRYANRFSDHKGWRLLDSFAPAMALGQALGRIGCFLAGCCFGKPCDLPWAVAFEDPLSLARPGFPLHPTQLYEALTLAALFVFLLCWSRRANRPEGETFSLYLILYSLSRLPLEHFRDDPRTSLGPINLNQLLGFAVAVSGVVIFRRIRKRHREVI